ncbi:uncharacterized protein LOC120116879 [Hibiscus syriacus]|uniref:uncharacterized protein LOC120116879 n=1 Tax=Hibiscus syriacus TaxID=106335 RepID=UPI001921F336|nr:uncharacterized protein LOC120116879 [Hibiscus syriacus]
MACRYFISIRQEHENDLEQLGFTIPHDLFHIDVEIRWIWPLDPQVTSETFNQSIVGRRDLFLSEENGRNIIRSTVADSRASPELIDAVIVPDILSFARDVDSLPMNIGRHVINLRAELLVEVSLDGEIDELIDESMRISVNFRPASKSSIEALKRVKWGDEDEVHLPLKKRRKPGEGLSSRKGCAICLDEFLDGDDVASTPCAHVYHHDHPRQRTSLEHLASNIPHRRLHIDIEIRCTSSLNPETTLETFNRSVFPNILSYARHADSLTVNLGRQVIKLRVEILAEVSPNEEIDELVDESLVNFKPANKSSIKSLKRVRYGGDEDEDYLPVKKKRKLDLGEGEGLSSRKECVVCLNELLDQDRVTLMPCGHIYHYDCIIKWLETSYLCPLCRYEMPTD